MQKQKTALIYGNFSVIHSGHLRLFRYAKNLAENLIVGVIPDQPNHGLQLSSQIDRINDVKAIVYVDEVQLIQPSLKNFIEKLKPDLIIKGKEHENQYNPEIEWSKKYGGKLVFSSGDVTSSLAESTVGRKRNDVFQIANTAGIFARDKGIKVESLLTQLNSFKNYKVCVIGDLIIDRYVQCHALGMSQEDPTLVVSPVKEDMFLGGAGIVAGHVASLGATVELLSVVGNDDEAKLAERLIESLGVGNQLIVDQHRPTTVKTRFKVDRKTLLRVNRLIQNSISNAHEQRIIDIISSNLSNYDLIIFSDFNYGCISQSLLLRLMPIIKTKNLLTIADSQSSSQIGNTARFKNMSLLCCTEYEARLACQDMECGLGVLIEKIQQAASPDRIILKLGGDGILLHDRKNEEQAVLTTIPAFNSNPVDVAGAGDTLMVSSALAFAAGAAFVDAAFLGSVSAAVQISTEGNTPTNKRVIEKILSGAYYDGL